MPNIKYMPNSHTIYIANPDEWEQLKNASLYISEEMYNDILLVNSGIILSYDKIGPNISHTNGVGYNKLVFLYPTADTGKVSGRLYSRLRKAASEGVTFRGSFRFSVLTVKPGEAELPGNEDLVGLQILFV